MKTAAAKTFAEPDEPYVIPASVIEQVTKALNVAITVTLMSDRRFHGAMQGAANALDDAVNDQPDWPDAPWKLARKPS